MKKKTVIISSIVIVALLVGIFVVRPLLRGRNNASIQTVALAKGDLADTVLVSGTVASSNSSKVYSKLAQYPVKEIDVEVGQKVKAGDVLARLDTTELENNIKQAELNIKNSQANINNESVLNKTNLESAQNAVDSAALDLNNAKTKYNDVKELVNNGSSTQDDLTQAQTAMEKAQIAYDNAQDNLKSAQSKSLTVSENNLEIQQLSLDELKKNLSDATLTAPIDGTVTMVNAVTGQPGTGLMFVVEETDHPIIQTSIGEYDIGSIKVGQDVIVKTDSTGDREFSGTVSKVAPAAQKDQNGNTDTSSDVSFATEVSLKDSDPSIKIGMDVRMTIKLNEKKDVYSVPYDAIVTNNDGSTWIEVQDPTAANRNGRAVYKEIPVKTGMQTDMDVEISGSDLVDGLKVVTDPQDVKALKTGKMGGLGRLLK